jgi:hypothetical protein
MAKAKGNGSRVPSPWLAVAASRGHPRLNILWCKYHDPFRGKHAFLKNDISTVRHDLAPVDIECRLSFIKDRENGFKTLC